MRLAPSVLRWTELAKYVSLTQRIFQILIFEMSGEDIYDSGTLEYNK